MKRVMEPLEAVPSVRSSCSYKSEFIREYKTEIHSEENSKGNSIVEGLTR
jgi:hypothetical protein